jgi:hypothetical protein
LVAFALSLRRKTTSKYLSTLKVPLVPQRKITRIFAIKIC